MVLLNASASKIVQSRFCRSFSLFECVVETSLNSVFLLYLSHGSLRSSLNVERSEGF